MIRHLQLLLIIEIHAPPNLSLVGDRGNLIGVLFFTSDGFVAARRSSLFGLDHRRSLSLHSLHLLSPSPNLLAMEEIEPAPTLNFKASPELLHLCEMDSLMPTTSRRELMAQESSFPHPPSSIQFDDEPLLQAGSPPKQSEKIISSSESGTAPSQEVLNHITTTNHASSLPLKGAWKSPLQQTPAIPTLRYNSASLLPDLDAQWPSLAAGNQNRSQRQSSHQSVPARKDYLASIDLDHGLKSPEYPWAAKMKPSSRNLHRVTTPTFMEDGTPKVCIPRQVLLEGVEHQKEFIIGQFYRCVAPTPGHIHAVLSRIWGNRCRIFTRKLGEFSFLFHIPDESTRRWILQRGLWHVDDCLMFVSAWNPVGTITLPEINTIPVWLTLRNIPSQLYSTKGISWIGSGLGAPMLTSKPWLDPTQMGEAKILVEIKLNKMFPPKVAVEDESGAISIVDVHYSWLPPKCVTCGQLGHKATRCLGKLLPNHQDKSPPTTDLVSTKASTPSQISEATNGVDVGTAPISATSGSAPIYKETSHANIEATGAPLVVTDSSLKSAENIDIATAVAETTLDETTLTETASSKDASIIPGDIPLPASPIVISEHLDESAAMVVVSNAEDVLDVCVNLGNEAMVWNDECFFQGTGLESMVDQQDEDLENASIKRTLRGRPVKQTQKMQEMEWTLVKGRGKRGRGGRGGHLS